MHGRSAPRSPCWRPGPANVIDHGRRMFERCTEGARRVLFFRPLRSQLARQRFIRKQLEDERRSLARGVFRTHANVGRR